MAKWSESSTSLLATMAAAGATASEIAAATGRTRSAVCGRANRLDISLGYEKDPPDDESTIWADPGPACIRASAAHLKDLATEGERIGHGWATYEIGSEPVAVNYRASAPISLIGSSALMCAEA